MRKGQRQSKEAREKMSQSHLGKTHSTQVVGLMRVNNVGEKNPMFGRTYSHTSEIRFQISESLSGENSYWFGRQLSDEHRNLLRLAKLGDKSSLWRGGISLLPYPFEFNDELKEKIRLRDGYRCRVCGIPQMECILPLAVHHIDYDKENLAELNLISLCHSCHGKTNHNRDFWTQFLSLLPEE